MKTGRFLRPSPIAVLAALFVLAASSAVSANPTTGFDPCHCLQASESSEAWQEKMDCALQVTAESAPDASLRLVIRTANVELVAKVQALAVAGFQPVFVDDDTGEILLTATVREAMVLAEDHEIVAIGLAPAVETR